MTDTIKRILAWAMQSGEYRAEDIIRRFNAYETEKKALESSELRKHIFVSEGHDDIEESA